MLIDTVTEGHSVYVPDHAGLVADADSGRPSLNSRPHRLPL